MGFPVPFSARERPEQGGVTGHPEEQQTDPRESTVLIIYMISSGAGLWPGLTTELLGVGCVSFSAKQGTHSCSYCARFPDAQLFKPGITTSLSYTTIKQHIS